MIDGIEVIRADAALLPACFALLPSLASPEAIVFAARDAADGRLLGAGGLLWRLWSDPPGMPAWIEVLPDSRRRGVGRALLAALRGLAGGETERLWATDAMAEDSASADFARAVGARAAQRQLHFEITDIAFLHQMTAITDRLAASGRIPADIAVRPIAEVDLTPIKWLIAEEMATPPPRLDMMLADAMKADPATAQVDRERSIALVAGDGSVAGAMLTRRVPADNASEILCNVVAPHWRRGFANAVLLQRFSQLSAHAGCYRIRFDCDERIRDTIGLARRGGADHVKTLVRFAYATAATAT